MMARERAPDGSDQKTISPDVVSPISSRSSRLSNAHVEPLSAVNCVAVQAFRPCSRASTGPRRR